MAQAQAYFQELMSEVLKDLLSTIAYLDDIFIYSKNAEDLLDCPVASFPQTLQYRANYKIELFSYSPHSS